MAIIKLEYDEEDERDTALNAEGTASYTVLYKCLADKGHCGGSIIILGQDAAGGPPGTNLPAGSDVLPLEGSHYNHFDMEDQGSFVEKIAAKLTGEGPDYDMYSITVEYAAPKSNSKREKEKTQKKNPLEWEPEYYTEWVEEQIPLEEAACLTDLPTILRGPTHETMTEVFEDIFRPPFGPIVNGAGQQTIDPLMQTYHRAILVSEKSYPYAFVANLLNGFFGQSVSALPFLGMPAGFWKYQLAAAGKVQEKEVPGEGTVKYITVVTKLESGVLKDIEGNLKFDHDKYILNNGQACFKRMYKAGEGTPIIKDPRFPGTAPADATPMLFPTVVTQLSEEWDEGSSTSDSTTGQPTLEDFVQVPSAEPMNLRSDGTQIGSIRADGEEPEKADPEEKTNHIQYTYLLPLDYNEMDYNDGTLTFTGPFAELVAEYEGLYGP